MTFRDFNFESGLQEGLDAMRFETPTPIQQQAIPLILANKDLIAVAQTGTGKTAAFLLPILHKLALTPSEHTDTLIIVPTRELAVQIDQALEGFSYFTGIGSIAVYGGGSGPDYENEKRALTQGANVVIATPGRLISHLNLGYVKLDNLKHLILDEADKMLNMGFAEDIAKIITYLPAQRQNLLFSATMPPAIRSLAKKILTNPEQINIAVSKPAEAIVQQAYLTYDNQKNRLIEHILKQQEWKSVLIFSSTKQKVKVLYEKLQHSGLKIKAIHSDLEQREREEVLIGFRSKQTQILVATDILSRGIDIEDIELVINYDVPGDAEDYIHRIGRTARANSTGQAITFINEADQRKFYRIENLIGNEIEKLALPDFLGEGPAYTPEAKPKKAFTPGNKHRKKPQGKRSAGKANSGSRSGH